MNLAGISKGFLFADANAQTIKLVSLDDLNWVPKVLFNHQGVNLSAVEYDHVEDKVYWTDISNGFLASGFRNATSVQRFLSCNIGSPEGMAIDWVGRNIYWTDVKSKRIEVSRLDGSKRKALITSDLDEPRAIVLDLMRG